MKKVFKSLLKLFIALISLVILVVVGYLIYLTTTYYRIADNINYTTKLENGVNEKVALETEYTVTTYNIGFGAYNHDFSFFLDSGTMKDGKEVSGIYSKAFSKEIVLDNINGAIDVIEGLNPDFMFFQEVDIKADRSHDVNQFGMLKDRFYLHGSLYASNFHTGFFAYPFNDMIGKSESGIVTMSNKNITNVVRYQLPVSDAFITKFFDLDRCFTASYLPIEGSDKFLVLVNVHLSAYDEGGVFRKQQIDKLNQFFESETSKGNYVVCGGDFNHDISNDPTFEGFETEQNVPEWVYTLTNDDLTEGSNMRFATAINAPTCRSTDLPYEKGVNYSVVIDGFIVSNNVEVVLVENIDADFQYSDHNPVMLKFKLSE